MLTLDIIINIYILGASEFVILARLDNISKVVVSQVQM